MSLKIFATQPRQPQKKPDASHKQTRTIALALLIAVAVLLLLFWMIWNNTNRARPSPSPSATSSGNATVQTNEGGQVTIKVTWQGRSAGPIFTVEMDTHAVNLDSYDLRQLAVLRTDQGQEIQPSGWNAPPGGHHRTGMLTFPATTASGTPVIGPKTRMLELIIRNVSGIPERRRHTLVPSLVLPQPRLLTQDERNEQGAQTANVLSPSAISQDPANPQQSISYASP